MSNDLKTQGDTILMSKGSVKIVTSSGSRLECCQPRLTEGTKALESLLIQILLWLAIDGRASEVLSRCLRKLAEAGYTIDP